MTGIATTPTIAPSAKPATAGNAGSAEALSAERRGLRDAAQGFEAMFVRQILAASRQDTFGGDKDLFGANPVSAGDDTFTQMRDDRFAEIASQSGAFGLARQLEAQLARSLAMNQPNSTEG